MPLAKNGIYFIQQLDNPRPYGREIVLRNSGFSQQEEVSEQECLSQLRTTLECKAEEKQTNEDRAKEAFEKQRKRELYMQDIGPHEFGSRF
ncbi:MAG: hypothetical protein RBS56_04350 [Candidatus Gracilibacteria bacterium]|nr:hypothetical protein [Candidatus Gracilibacteria bacterium]